MKASLQSLLSLPEFVNFFLGSPEEVLNRAKKYNSSFQRKLESDSIITLVNNFINKYYDSDDTSAEATTLRKKFAADFSLGDQHDAQEFTLALLETLKRELNPSEQQVNLQEITNSNEAWRRYKKSHPSIIDLLFVGLKETLYC